MRNRYRLEVLDPDGRTVVAFGDQAAQALTTGTLTRRKGRKASSVTVTCKGITAQIVDGIPLPYSLSGAEAEVRLYVGQGRALPLAFSGRLASLTYGVPGGGMKLTANDEGRALRRAVATAVYSDVSVQRLATSLIEAQGLTADFSGAQGLDSVVYSQIVQMGESSADVLTRVLEDSGHTYMVRGSTVYVRSEAQDAQVRRTLRATVGDNLLTAEFKVADLTRRTTPNVNGELTQGVDPLSVEVRTEQRGAASVYTNDRPSYSDESLRAAAQAQARARRLFEGTLALAPGFDVTIDLDDQVAVQGVSRRFDGVWFVDDMTYDIRNDAITLGVSNGGA